MGQRLGQHFLANDYYAKVLADAVRIERLTGDFGADDDYHLQAGSPGWV